MKVLFITHKPFLPTLDGGNAASLALAEQLLSEFSSMDYLTFSSAKHPFQPELFLSGKFKNVQVKSFFVNLKLNPWKIIFSFITRKPYQIERFENQDFLIHLKEILSKSKFDYLVFDSLFSAQMIERIKRTAPNQKFILRTHNVESMIWKRKANHEKNKLKKFYFNHSAKVLQKREIEIYNQFDLILTISINDEKIIKEWTKTNVLTLPYFPSKIEHKWVDKPNSCMHFGAMNWHPNRESLDRLLQQILPKIQTECPEIELFVAGSFMETYPKLEIKNVHWVGFVESQEEFLSSHGILLAPISTGSGVRIKIIEALSLGVPVVTTSQGVEGIPIQHGNGILICDSDQEFSEATVQLLKNEEFRASMSQKAFNFMQEWEKSCNLTTIFEANV